MAMSDAGGVSAHSSIYESMLDEEHRHRPTDDVERLPEPDEKPDPAAQWDEVHGVWMRWHEDEDRWVPLEEPDAADG
jgi:hypothetical protein